MAALVPNFHFFGQCADAMALYTLAFGAETTYCLRYGEAADDAYDAPGEYIYHAEMLLYGQRIMLSDGVGGAMAKEPPMSLAVMFADMQALMHAYDVLIKQGTIIYPLKETGYAEGFVSLYDAYGVRWELMCERKSA